MEGGGIGQILLHTGEVGTDSQSRHKRTGVLAMTAL